ncbi:MAG: DUF3105 domain-containing protein [Actinomycetota bacterium]|nr:DUF3105 domain-containing protein [Actinomycetota bacterium]
MRILERVAIGVASLALSIGLIAVLSGFFASRDQAGVSGTADTIGQGFRDLGHAHLRPGDRPPVYDSNPPTSGAHVPELAPGQEARLNNDQLLQALEVGDLVVVYGGRNPPPGLREFARAVAGPFSSSLAAAGQAVLLDPRPGTVGLIGLAWARMVRVSAANDALLRTFAQHWLGRGAPGR